MKVLLALSLCLTALPATAGPVTGRVVDPTDRPVPAAVVILVVRGAAGATAVTNTHGEFSIDAPDAGEYELRVSSPGFRAEPLRASGDSGARDIGAIRLTVSAVSEAIVVSAAQVEIPLSEATPSITVVTGAELQARQVHSVADALRSVPGMTVARAGGVGAVTGVFPRGGESNFTLVFVDDVPVNAFGGEFDFAHLSTANVDRIEVVRGPQSALFGSNAIGGVIRIVTRRGGRPSISASAESGAYDTQRFTGATSGARGAFEWGASAERLASEGFNGRRTASGAVVSNDDYERTSGAFSAGWRMGDARLRADVRHATDERGVPGPFGTNPKGAFGGIDAISRNANEHSSVSALASLPVSPRVRALLVTAFNRLESEFVSPFGPSEASSRRWSARAQADFAMTPELALSAGAELQRERAGSTYITGETFQPIPIRRSVGGYFAEARWTPDARLVVAAGLRLENVRQAAIESSPNVFSPRPALEAENVLSLNPRVSAAWFARREPGSHTRLRASAGTGIRPPSAFDLAFTDNPSLRPERSFSAEGGIEQAFGDGRAVVDAVGFVNTYDDLIVAVGSFRESSRYTTDNISNARSRGVELGLTARHRAGGHRPIDLQARVAYTWLDTEILAVDEDDQAPPPFTVGDPLLRQPRHQFSTHLTLSSGALTAFASGGGRSRALDVEPSLGTFGGLFHSRGFQTWNIGASWGLRFVDVFGRVENIFDRQYEEVLGFPALGRRATIGLRVASGR